MWSKIGSFFSGFFKNIAADPVSSMKGVVSLFAGGAACYGMATGAVPISVGAPIAAHAVTSGIVALGTDNATGVLDPVAAKAAETVNMAAAATPTAMTISDHYQEIVKQAGQAQAVLSAATEAAAALQALSAPAEKAE